MRSYLSLTLSVLFLLALGCASATTKISNRGQLYLSISYSNRQAWVKKPFTPQNRYGINLRADPTSINEPVTILQITHEIGGNRVEFRRENGEVQYLVLDADSADRAAELIEEYFYLDEPKKGGPQVGESGPAGLSNLIVLRNRTPIKRTPDITGETIKLVNAGDRVAPVNPDRGGQLDNWWLVTADSSSTGWVHEQFVSEPVPPGSPEERVLRSDAVRNANSLEKLSRQEQVRREGEQQELEAKINPGWPYEVRNAIRHHRLLKGMSQEMVKLSLGYPDDIIWSTTPDGTDERWIFKSPDRRFKTVYFQRDRVASWEE